MSDEAEAHLGPLLHSLAELGYDFVTPTPATQARVVGRASKQVARDLRDVFGWSLPFEGNLLPRAMLDLLRSAGVLQEVRGLLRSQVRVSRLRSRLFLHSAYPTEAEDAVFFGPDSYRFVEFLHRELRNGRPVQRLVDMGAGSGVGGISAAALVPGAQITLLDVNDTALRLASINARTAKVDVEGVHGSGLEDVEGPIDLVIANPPYVMDESDRTYRNGGDMHGARISLDWTLEAARRLERGGRMLLYTGVAIVNGEDELRTALERTLPDHGCALRYQEIDPDVFGEELENELYADVERIAVIGAVIEKRG